jgi:hypothetical protein
MIMLPSLKGRPILNGAITLSIMTLFRMGLFGTLSMTVSSAIMLSVTFFIVMQSDCMVSVVMLNFIMLVVIKVSVVMLSVVMPFK